MSDRKHPNDFEDKIANTVMQMAQDGLVVIEGDRVTITEKGRRLLKEGKS